VCVYVEEGEREEASDELATKVADRTVRNAPRPVRSMTRWASPRKAPDELIDAR